jgi:hypothetical protein
MRPYLLVFFSILLATEPLTAQDNEGLKIPGFTYRLDLRTAADNPDRLGIDFDLTYEANRGGKDPAGLHYGLKVNAKGFQTFDRDVHDIDAMVAEVGLLGYYYHVSDFARIPPEMVVRYLELSDIEVENQTDAQTEELTAIQERMTHKRWFATFDLHYRYETDQTVTDDEHAFGFGASAEVPIFANLLDVVPALTRAPTNNASFRPQPVRAFVGLDRVIGADETAVGALTGENNYWRARLEAAWATRILQGFTLRMSFEGAYILDADEVLEASGRDLTSFFQTWLLYPLSDRTNLMVKYISGRLPPDYDAATTGKVGLNIMLQ